MNEINVKIKSLHPDAKIPAYATDLAAGFDLVAVEDVIIAPGETAKVPLGLAFEIPAGYEIQIRPRSGVTLNTRLRVANSPGTCDADFRGEVNVLLDNIAFPKLQIGNDGRYGPSFAYVTVLHTLDGRSIDAGGLVQDGSYIVRKGDRVAQGVLACVPHVLFNVAIDLDETERGGCGFGSTGIG